MKTLLKFLMRLLAGFLGLIFLYLLVAVILSLIPVNTAYPVAREGVPVYITTNGVHADFTVPVATPAIDWRNHMLLKDYKGAGEHFQYIAFGWGDKGFYLHTPLWEDLTFSTAAKALLLPSPTAMHVTYLRRPPAPGEDSHLVYLSETQYQQLVAYILASFAKTEKDSIILIPEAGYSSIDNFYEARGSYSLLYTCNNWVNQGLKEIGIKTALWSPFDKGIMYQLKREN